MALYTTKISFNANSDAEAYALAQDVFTFFADHYEETYMGQVVTSGDGITDDDLTDDESLADAYDRMPPAWKAEHSVTLDIPVER